MQITVKDFPTNSSNSNISEITLSTRYPEEGSALNTVSEMTVYIKSGSITLTAAGVKQKFVAGSVALVPINTEYYWELEEGYPATILIFSTPPWTKEQQKIIK